MNEKEKLTSAKGGHCRQVICGKTAFRFYRTPPQVIAMMPAINMEPEISARMKLTGEPLVENVLGRPIDFICENNCSSGKTWNFNKRSWTGDFPEGAVLNHYKCGLIASPAFTLYTLAKDVDFIRLVMFMYEMVGRFAVYTPSRDVENALETFGNDRRFRVDNPWARVFDKEKGFATNLWMRKPILTLEELRDFASSLKPRRGHRMFNEAVDCVTGVCASPFEVQVSMLLGMPRRLGGLGLELANNVEIEFGESARLLARQKKCYIDIMLSGDSETPPLAIECQGASVHNSQGKAQRDFEREAALRAEGLNVLFLTYKHTVNEERFRVIQEFVMNKLGKRFNPNWVSIRDNEPKLRDELFSNWECFSFAESNWLKRRSEDSDWLYYY